MLLPRSWEGKSYGGVFYWDALFKNWFMNRTNWIIIGLAYIIGLLSTSLMIDSTSGLSLKRLAMGTAILVALAAFMAIAQRRWITVALKIKARVWIVAVMVAIFAVGYFQLRIPQPKYNDISYQITKSDRKASSLGYPKSNRPLVHVRGTVLNEPRLNDRQRLKFWLKVVRVDDEVVSGKLYATLPLLQRLYIITTSFVEKCFQRLKKFKEVYFL